MYLDPIFVQGHNLSFFGFGPWAIIHGPAKLANTFIAQIWSLMIPFETSLSKLSENHKIVEIGSTEFKLWQLKESPNNWTEGCSWTSFNSHNFSTVDPMSTFFRFFESSERDLSNDVFQSNYLFGTIICHFLALDHGPLSMVCPILILIIIWTSLTPFERYLSKLQKIRKLLKLNPRNSSHGWGGVRRRSLT